MSPYWLGHVVVCLIFLSASLLAQYEVVSGWIAFSVSIFFTLIVGKKAKRISDEEVTFLRDVVDNLPVAVFCKDSYENYRFKLWNKAAEKLWGLASGQVIGKNDYDFFSKKDSDFFREKDEKVLRSRQGQYVKQEQITHQNGEKQYLRTIKVAIHDRFLLGTSEDITVLKNAEQELLKNQSSQNVLFENLVEGVVLQDADGKILRLNRAAEEILARPEGTLVGMTSTNKSWQPICEDGKILQIEDTPSNLARRTGRPQHNVILGMNRPDGSIRWLSTNAVPIFEKDEEARKLSQILVTFRDITDEREQKIKLIQASKMSSLGEMSAGIAHEINNPLAIIKGKVQQISLMLARGRFEPEQLVAHAEKIDVTVDRISKIIKGLRCFARDSDGDPIEEVFVNSLVDDTLSFCQSRFLNYQIDLKIAPIPSNLKFECRAASFSQVLLNLLNNAFDAVVELDERWVSLEVKEDVSFLEFRITDSGRGIPSHIREKILQPFYTTKPVGRGTGLGLSIASGIVKSHQGVLEIDEKSPNTCFVILIPKKQILNQRRAA